MNNKVSQNPSNISFKASILANRQVILNTLTKDKKLTSNDFSIITKLLDNVDSFSKMKEDSIVEVSSKVDRWQTKIICNVYDKTKKIFEPVHQRTVSLLTGDETYREKHINSLKALIKNVSITRKSVDKIKTDTINLKNNHFNAKNVEDCFENSAFTSAFVKSLNESYNPTKKIVNLLKSIDKKTKDGTEISLEIVRKKGPLLASNHQYFVVSFKNGEKVEEKSVLLSELFKKPLEYRLIQK